MPACIARPTWRCRTCLAESACNIDDLAAGAPQAEPCAAPQPPSCCHRLEPREQARTGHSASRAPNTTEPGARGRSPTVAPASGPAQARLVFRGRLARRPSRAQSRHDRRHRDPPIAVAAAADDVSLVTRTS